MKPAAVKPFADVKDQIAVDLKQQYASKAFTDNAEGFHRLRKAKSLQPAADKYKLTIQTATVTPTPNPQLPPTAAEQSEVPGRRVRQRLGEEPEQHAGDRRRQQH